MRVFNVYQHGEDELLAVKRGFSWPGFFFSAFWAAHHRLWLLAFGVVTVTVVGRKSELQGPWRLMADSGLVLVALLVGVVGNSLRGQQLQKHGWSVVKTVAAHDPDAAVAAVQKERKEDPEAWKQEQRLRQSRELGRQLAQAAMDGDAAVVKDLLAAGADPKWKGSTGATALMAAAQGGHAEVVDLLIAAGSEANAANTAGVTPLILAAQNGHVNVTARLLAAGADVQARDEDGDTALSVAQNSGHVDIVGLLSQGKE